MVGAQPGQSTTGTAVVVAAAALTPTARAALVGMWTRLAADVGQFVALLVFHLATAFSEGWPNETHAYTRYVFAAAMAFVLLLIVRDVWALTVTNNLAGRIRGRQ